MRAVGEPTLGVIGSGEPIVPFVKWAGGKRQLLPHLLALRPPRFERYVEPFLGGGALYFALAPERALLGDLNDELIDTYRAIRDDVEGVMAALDRHRYDREHYYAVRRLHPWDLPPAERAARFIYLNKTGYNGLYRVNRRGEFNVPFGRYRTPPRLYDPANLRAAAALLAGAQLVHGPYEKTLAAAQAGDFVYLDPPYQPLSPSANFTRYTRYGFAPGDQQRLAREFRRLSALGAYVMLSNSNTPLVRELYRGFHIVEVEANRLINSDSRRRTGITELVIRNYA
ncbi:MAG: DNA adenine methylase [Chloroflexota bacterium]|nr:DNA adenine methylase [Dehalococcoidia bacterium]MDW8254273.1 DNA adenine methylase [Chloroflexota bacterium]